ncbi:protein phosphatase regulator, partial [Sporothrix epigloea]
MLGDQAEKTKNPLKSAMRRRKTKTVSFAPPTYVDSSDIDYSTDEEDLEAEYFAQQQQAQQQQQQQQQESKEVARTNLVGRETGEAEDDTAKVEPLKTRTPKENGKTGAGAKSADDNADGVGGKDLTRTSEDSSVVSKSETPGPKKTKDGTVRDSFFKDDTVETKKITLTPNLLRDDSALRTSSDSKEVKQRPSFETLDKDINSNLIKDDKKKKDKKQGGFRSLFSRKDKKRSENEDDESLGKRSMDIGSESTERDFDEIDEDPVQEKASLAPSTAVTVPQGPQKQPSKLQKQQPLGRIVEASPTREPADSSATRKGSEGATIRVLDAEGALDTSNIRSQYGSLKTASPFSAANKAVSAITSDSASTPQATRPHSPLQTTVGAVLDESEMDDKNGVPKAQRQAPVIGEEQNRSHPDQNSLAQQQQAFTNSVSVPGPLSGEHFSASSPQSSPGDADHPPALLADTFSQGEEEDRSSPISSSSPELVESDNRRGSILHHAQDSITTSTSATTANTATWNDVSLRAFFDSGTDVRDLLVVVYDKNDIVPAGPDHPVVSTLFKEQNAKLAEITSQLDNMLGDWLARKQR